VGDKLPGALNLARHYGCSMEVERRALWILHGQGLVREPRQGLYTRVVARPEPARLGARDLLAELQKTVHGLEAKLEALAAALAG
jgi:DNA-binding FadR family transcriptional regulator